MQNLTATTGEKLTLQQLVSSLKEQNLFKKDMVIPSANLSFENGMIRKDDAFNKIHLGAKMEQFTTVKWSETTRQKNYELILSQVKDAVKTFCSPEYLGGWISEIIAKGSEELKHPTDAVKNACRVLYMPEEKEADILNYFIKGGDTTAFGITQALTYYAGQDATAEERYELESGAVSVLDNIKTIDRPVVQQRAKKALSGYNPSQNVSGLVAVGGFEKLLLN